MLSESHRDGWVFVPDVGYFIPRDHVEVVEQVKAEIANPEYSGRTHGKPATRNAGCTGPLCKKALRDRMRPEMRRLHGYTAERRSRVRDLDPLLTVLIERFTQEPVAC